MIDKEVSKYVLMIGPNVKGEGGVSKLLNSYSSMFSIFNIISSNDSKYKLFSAFYAVFQLISWCIFKNVKIVHVHTSSYNSFYRKSIYILIAKVFRKKILLHLHCGFFKEFYSKSPKYCKYICRKADYIIAISNFIGNVFYENSLNNNVVTIYNTVEAPLYIKKKLQKKNKY